MASKKNNSTRKPNQDLENNFDKFSNPDEHQLRDQEEVTNQTIDKESRIERKTGNKEQMNRSHTSR